MVCGSLIEELRLLCSPAEETGAVSIAHVAGCTVFHRESPNLAMPPQPDKLNYWPHYVCCSAIMLYFLLQDALEEANALLNELEARDARQALQVLEARAQTRPRPMKIVAWSRTPISPAWIESKADVIGVCNVIVSVLLIVFALHVRMVLEFNYDVSGRYDVTSKEFGARGILNQALPCTVVNYSGAC